MNCNDCVSCGEVEETKFMESAFCFDFKTTMCHPHNHSCPRFRQCFNCKRKDSQIRTLEGDLSFVQIQNVSLRKRLWERI